MIIMTAMQKEKLLLASGQNLRGSVEISACVNFSGLN